MSQSVVLAGIPRAWVLVVFMLCLECAPLKSTVVDIVGKDEGSVEL